MKYMIKSCHLSTLYDIVLLGVTATVRNYPCLTTTGPQVLPANTAYDVNVLLNVYVNGTK